MMCPPSLASSSSMISIESDQQILGTPQFHPEDHQQLPIVADYQSIHPLDAKVEVVLEPNGGDCLEMFGTSKTGTSYSLPGHVLLTLPPVSPPFEAQGRNRLVKELKVTFEGKTECCDDAGRYQVMRLVKTEVPLLPLEGFELPSQSHVFDPQAFIKETAYAIPFDLKIPGWLPQSFENETVAIAYGLIATVKLGWSAQVVQPKADPDISHAMDVDDSTFASSIPIPIVSAAPQCYSSRFFPRLAKTVASALATAISLPSSASTQKFTRASAWQAITVVRHRVPAPPSGTMSLFSPEAAVEQNLRHYTLRPAENSPSPVECVVSVPDTIDINGPTLRVSVRLRAREGFTIAGSDEGQAQDPSPASFTGPTDQEGRSPSPPGGNEASTPATTESATSSPSKHPGGTARKEQEQIRMVELGMEVEETERYSSSPAQPFMAAYPIPEDQPSECSPYHGSAALLSPPSRLSSMSLLGLTSSQTFKGTRTRTLLLGEDGKSRTYKFDGDGLELGSGWRKVNIIIPMPTAEADATSSDDINRKPASEIDTPFLRIKHKLKIRIVCRSRAMPGQDTIVVLTTPLRCGTAPQPRLNPLSIDSATFTSPPGPSQVPAYCQLFHENGTAREDDEALPLYEPDSPPAYASALFPERLSGGQVVPVSTSLSLMSESGPAESGNPQLDNFAPISAGVSDSAGGGTLPPIPGPRGCRSVSSLSSISENDQSSDESQEESVFGTSSPEPGQRNGLSHMGYFGFPTRLENRLISMADRSSSESSEAVPPEYLDAARRRAVSRAKQHCPTPSRLSETIGDH
ncbi:hypothetical protein NliqN6_4203 [Naganishia liquefaciens]|uniref:Uncharacterized protein n=1 Tax=Naganishia liquefaciens TaxID=104408 RepID=A0A8H3TVP4_9TREE|nr:hypothetical protein NliqN6_4203 [Naganishia liquefaciens]